VGHSITSNVVRVFQILLVAMILLNVGTLLQTYNRLFFHLPGGFGRLFIIISYIGICFSPILVFYLGLLFRDPHMRPRPIHSLLSIFPLLSMIFIIHPYLSKMYFFTNYSVFSDLAEYGTFYYIHSAYSYILLGIGVFYILYSSIKVSGFFSRQSLIISIGLLLAIFANVLYSFNIIQHLTFDITACALTLVVLCFSIAIFKYKFLSVTPIALKKIVNIISDGYIVIDTEYRIVAYNNSIFKLFNNSIKISFDEDMRDTLQTYYAQYLKAEELETICETIHQTGKAMSVEKHFQMPNYDKYFSIEFSPVYTNNGNKAIGTIILFKDITRSRKDLEIIQESMAVMLERERLVTLGHMVGGLAHNLKTPIMSISGGLEAIDGLAKEYDDAIGNNIVTQEDHHEIAKEIMDWVDKIKKHCSYMSDMISTVKGQTVHFNTVGVDKSFNLTEFIKRLEMIMRFEIKKYNCDLHIDLQTDGNHVIEGEINSLIQIFDNLIQNSIYAYYGKAGKIDLTIVDKDGRIVFTLVDYGRGMPEEVKSKLFKEMITTKGKDGTGIGLYMTYATVKGNFNGEMKVESQLNKGSTFVISLPYIKTIKR
jgi:signal transduction histidine kinase